MKHAVSILVFSLIAVFGSHASEATRDKFLSEVGFPAGDNGSVTNEWVLPESFDFGGMTWTTTDHKGSPVLGLVSFSIVETNDVPPVEGRGVAFQFQTERQLHDYIASRLACTDYVPDDYAELWSVQTNSIGLIRLKPHVPNGTNGVPSSFETCFVLFKNIGISVSGLSNACELAETILEAGGVDIPAEPESPEPNPE